MISLVPLGALVQRESSLLTNRLDDEVPGQREIGVILLRLPAQIKIYKRVSVLCSSRAAEQASRAAFPFIAAIPSPTTKSSAYRHEDRRPTAGMITFGRSGVPRRFCYRSLSNSASIRRTFLIAIGDSEISLARGFASCVLLDIRRGEEHNGHAPTGCLQYGPIASSESRGQVQGESCRFGGCGVPGDRANIAIFAYGGAIQNLHGADCWFLQYHLMARWVARLPTLIILVGGRQCQTR